MYSFFRASDVEVATVNPNTGELGTPSHATSNLFPAIIGATPVSYGKFLYVSGFDQTDAVNGVWIFEITGKNGELTLVQSPRPYRMDNPAGNLMVDTKNGRLYTYGEYLDANLENVATISAYSINATGAPTDGPVVHLPPYSGSAIPPIIDAAGSRIYCGMFTPEGFKLLEFSINSATGELTQVSGSPFLVFAYSVITRPDSAQFLVSPTGNFVYVSVEGQTSDSGHASYIYAYSVDSTSGAISSVPGSPFSAGNPTGLSSVMAPSGKFLYVPLGGYGPLQGISTIPVDPVYGTISTSPTSTIAGGFSGWLFVDPTGSVLISAAANSSSVWTFKLDGSSGAISQASGSPVAFATADYWNYETSIVVKVP